VPFGEFFERPQVSRIFISSISRIDYLEQHYLADATFYHAYFGMAGNDDGALKAIAEHYQFLHLDTSKAGIPLAAI